MVTLTFLGNAFFSCVPEKRHENVNALNYKAVRTRLDLCTICTRYDIPSSRLPIKVESVLHMSRPLPIWTRSSDWSPMYGLLGSRMNREDHVTYIKSITVCCDFFWERNVGTIFFIIRFLQSSCRNRPSPNPQRSRCVRITKGWFSKNVEFSVHHTFLNHQTCFDPFFHLGL